MEAGGNKSSGAEGVAVAARDAVFTVKNSIIFLLTFSLLLLDYASRQAINAIFPVLKAEWRLSDTELGSLVSIVVLTVGILTVPLSMVADRFGRAKSIAVMAVVWSLATLACGLAANYGQMFAARLAMGVGEAAYASAGLAILIGIFPARMRTTIVGLFLAGAIFGSILGLAAGGAVAAHFGWRTSFYVLAGAGALLGIIYPLVVSDRRQRVVEAHPNPASTSQASASISFGKLAIELVSTRSLVCAYLGGGLQLFVLSAFITWIPSFLNRSYGLSMSQAAVQASALVLAVGVGMIACSVLTDRIGRSRPSLKMIAAGVYCLLTAGLLLAAFTAPHGSVQIGLIAAGMFFAGGTSGPAAAIPTDVSRASIHATILGFSALANALLGQAPGPFVTGMIADRSDLMTALRIVPLVSLAACAAFWLGQRYYDRDVARIKALAETAH